MADITIADLPAAAALTGTEVIPAIQSGADVKVTVASILTEALDLTSATGELSMAQVSGLVAALSGKAADSNTVHKAGNESIDGTKTFTSAPAVPANSWTISDTNGLQAELDAKATDSGLVHTTGAENVAGVKTFAASPIVPTPTTAFQAATMGYVDAAVAATATAGAVYVGAPGGVDDTALVVAARTAAGSGGTLIFASGTYVVDGLQASVSNQHWIVRPSASIKTKTGADTPTIDVTVNGIKIDGGGTIDGNRVGQTDTDIGHSGLGTTACVRIISRTNVVVQDLTIVNGGSNGIMVDASSYVDVVNNRVSGCSPTGNSKQIMVLDVVGSSTGIRIKDNHIDAVSRTNGCISILNQAATRVIDRLDISGNTCLVGEGGGVVETLAIELFTVVGGFIRDAKVSGNTVSGPVGVTSADLIYGISCGGDSSGASDGNFQVTITGNTVRNCPALAIEAVGSGIAITGNTCINSGPIAVLAVTVAGGVRSVSVTGNTIIDSIDLSYCLRIDGGTNGINGLVVSGNTVRNNAAGYVMLIDGEVNGSSFTGNTFTDCNGPGIGVLGPLVDSIIANNVIDLTGVGGATADGILLADTGIASLGIVGNTIKGAARTGVYVNAAVDHLRIVGNEVYNCGAYGILATTATDLSIASNDVHDNTTANYLTTGSTFVTHVINDDAG